MVVLLVAASAVYSLWRLLGVRQRLWLLDQLLPMAQRAHVGWPARVESIAADAGPEGLRQLRC